MEETRNNEMLENTTEVDVLSESETVKEEVISKKLYDKLASEVARLKKERKAKMTADEQAQLEKQELLDKIAAYEKNEKLNAINTSLSNAGIKSKNDIASMLLEGDYSKAIEEIGKAYSISIVELQKTIKSLEMENTANAGTPTAGVGGITEEQALRSRYMEAAKNKNTEKMSFIIRQARNKNIQI